MSFKSIKWRLQIWYGLILVGVLAGFGFTSYQLERGKQFRRIDEELRRRGGALAGVLRPPRPVRNREAMDQFPDRPPPGQRGPDRPDDEGFPDHRLLPDEFHLPPLQAGMFDQSDTNEFYFIVWARDGKELARSANAPRLEYRLVNGPLTKINALPTLRQDMSFPKPPEFGGEIHTDVEGRGQRILIRDGLFSMRGPFRELEISMPPGERILVGRNIAPELGELNLTVLKLTGVGAVILLLGLAGGWWIASRAMRPIEDISATATKISAGDLSQRINVADTENELGQLAGTLNSTFSRLEAAFGQQQQFTADAAHELRTPVAVILTETQATLKRERTAEEYRQSVEVCQRITQRMRRLIESLFQLARLDAGQEQLSRMQFDLAGTVNECVELIRPLADERKVKIECELPTLECAGDAERISQVITNLLTNAVQYNKPDGEVLVSGRQENGMTILTVADTGPGISAEDLPRLFERFYRAEKSRSSGNAGLGLSISKAIVEAHGGTIEVSSQQGTGTTFTVRLPSKA